jgi:hyperosmotically inducible protein
MFTFILNLIGCAGTPTQESLGEYTDDTIITTRVKSAIIKDPELSAAEINVETFKGKVQLSGFISSQHAINRAVQIARAVKGVKEINNKMELKTQKTKK